MSIHLSPNASIQGGPLDHLHARLSVDHGRLRERPDGGIVVDASRLDLGDTSVAMALIADLSGVDGGRNTGASATSSIDSIICAYRQDFMDTLAVSDVIWIELDSMGAFDQIVCHVSQGVTEMHWAPLISGRYAGRTEADFIALYGFSAERALAFVKAAVARSHG